VARLDLLDRSSVDQLVRDLGGPLHILVNNAGVMAIPNCAAARKDMSCNSLPTTSATSASP
jgi:NAD(P)-dependent dehydrogenase (short-subunit alcohol dehydrogenase family)